MDGLDSEQRRILSVHDEACMAIGTAIIAINQAEQAIDHAIYYYYKLQEPAITLLPFMDFRSKLELIKSDECLEDVFGKELYKRLHAIYDKRNIIAHGYIKIPTGDDSEPTSDGSHFLIREPRRSRQLTGNQIWAATDEARLIVQAILEAREEINGLINPIQKILESHPKITSSEAIEKLRQLLDEE